MPKSRSNLLFESGSLSFFGGKASRFDFANLHQPFVPMIRGPVNFEWDNGSIESIWHLRYR